MDKPTDEQVKEFWEWYGIKGESYVRDTFGEFGGRVTGVKYPDIDLNNLFRYVVPRAIFRMMAKWERSNALDILFANWLHEWKLNSKDPALALFWALWQVKEAK